MSCMLPHVTSAPGACKELDKSGVEFVGAEEKVGNDREGEGVPIGESIKGMGAVGERDDKLMLPNCRERFMSEGGSGNMISFSLNLCSKEIGEVGVGERNGEVDERVGVVMAMKGGELGRYGEAVEEGLEEKGGDTER